jgi:D-alanyl-D-alanine carboxypeptidase
LTAALTAAGCGSDAGSQTSQSISAPPSTAGPSASVAPPSASPSLSLSPLGPIPTASLNTAKAAELQAVLQAAVAGGAPDAIAAVITAEEMWAGAAGIGGPDGRAATAEDEFAIASVTKVFTATLVMRLAEQGQIELDAPLQSYLGGLDVDTNGSTVRQAVGMRTGLPDFGIDSAAAIVADPGHTWTPTELLARLVPPTEKPGTYIYSNPNYLLLALAVEHVTGSSFAAALRTHILDPVGAARILEQGAGETTPKPWALPTAEHRGAFAPEDLGVGDAISCISSATFAKGGASMASDAPSLASWAWHLFAGDIISSDSLQAMMPTATDRRGFGLDQMTGLAGHSAFGHGGSKTGYGSILVVLPKERLVVVMFVNDPDFIVEPALVDLIEAATGG